MKITHFLISTTYDYAYDKQALSNWNIIFFCFTTSLTKSVESFAEEEDEDFFSRKLTSFHSYSLLLTFHVAAPKVEGKSVAFVPLVLGLKS